MSDRPNPVAVRLSPAEHEALTSVAKARKVSRHRVAHEALTAALAPSSTVASVDVRRPS